MVYRVKAEMYCNRIIRAGETLQTSEYESLDAYQKELCEKVQTIEDLKKKPAKKDEKLFDGEE